MGRRHRLDIFADILRNAKTGIKKTPLVYRTNSNFGVIRDYLKVLEERELVELKEGLILTTSKGSAFLEKYDILMQLLGTEKPHLKPVTRNVSKVILDLVPDN